MRDQTENGEILTPTNPKADRISLITKLYRWRNRIQKPFEKALNVTSDRGTIKNLRVKLLLLMFIAGLIFLGCAALCLLISFGAVWTVAHYKFAGARTTGHIIGTKPAIHDQALLNPIVAFTTADGQNVEFKSVEICKAEDLGKSVEICYLPAKPTIAEYARHGEWGMLKDAAVNLLLAAVFAIIGVIAIFFRHIVHSLFPTY